MDKKSKLLSRNGHKYTQPESEENSKNFKELITYAMLSNKELKELEKKAKNNRVLKGFFTGKYANNKLYYYIKGLQVLKMVANGGLRAYDTYLHTNLDKSKHVIAKQIALELGSSVMNIAFDIAHNKLCTEYEVSKNTYMLEQMCNFLDDARNVVTEQKDFDGVKIRKSCFNKRYLCTFRKICRRNGSKR